jgi:hypothetical protein
MYEPGSVGACIIDPLPSNTMMACTRCKACALAVTEAALHVFATDLANMPIAEHNPLL